MSNRMHEAQRSVKKAPQKSLKEKRAEKREKKLRKNSMNDIRKVFEASKKEE